MSKISEEIVDGGLKWDIRGMLMEDEEWSALATIMKDENKEPLRELSVRIDESIWDQPATPQFFEFAKAVGAHHKVIKFRCDSSSKYAENNQQAVLWRELSKNRTIKHLCLDINEFDLNKNRALSKILNNNQTLIRLDIRLTGDMGAIDHDVLLEFARSLPTTVLERLNTSLIDDKGLKILLQHLPSKLNYLDLCNNNITEVSFPVLESFIKSNHTLKELILYDNIAVTYLEQHKNINAWKMPIQILQASSFEATLASKEFSLTVFTEDMSSSHWKMFVDELTKDSSTWRDLDVIIRDDVSSTCFNQLLTVIGREQCKLLRLTIRYDKLPKEKQIDLFHALHKNKSIHNFRFNCKLDSDMHNFLFKILNDKSKITHLRIDDNTNMDDKEVTKLAQCLEKKTKFIDLALNSTLIGDKGFQVLLKSLPSTLESFQLKDSLITAKILPAILVFFEEHPALEIFRLEENGISMQSKEVNVPDMLENISNVANDIGCDFTIETNEVIKGELTKVNGHGDIEISLFSGKLRDDHVLELCSALKVLSNDRNRNWIFDFGFNPRISSFSFQQLANILSTLSIIDLSFLCCELNEEKVKILCSGLVKIKTLKKLHMGSNGFGSQGIEHIVRYLQNNTTLINLDLSENNIKDAGAIQLASVLSKTRLEELSLYKNSIGDGGCASILSSLPRSLIMLDLKDNQITKTSLDKIVQFLSANRTLKDLYMDPNPIFGRHWYKDGYETVKCWRQAKEASEKNKICELH